MVKVIEVQEVDNGFIVLSKYKDENVCLVAHDLDDMSSMVKQLFIEDSE